MRVTDAPALREAVLPMLWYVAPELEDVDFAAFLADQRNLVLQVGENYSLFEHVAENVYRGHYLLAPTTRGKQAVSVCKLMLNELFTTYSARAIEGVTPRKNRAARVLNRCLGFVPVCGCKDAIGRDCVLYVLERVSWESRQSLGLAAAQKPPN